MRADGPVLSFTREAEGKSVHLRANLSDAAAGDLQPWQVELTYS